jgi:hypothetical protein
MLHKEVGAAAMAAAVQEKKALGWFWGKQQF